VSPPADKVGQTGCNSSGKERERLKSDREQLESEHDRTFRDALGDGNECI
jgi:hypothetical protein